MALVVLLSAAAGGSLRAQAKPNAAAASLDRWVVTRYRGAGLLPDTAPSVPSMASTRTPPRIETVREGDPMDTLWVVHFSAQDQAPAFATNSIVRLSGPTGAVSPLTARVVARRPFRAPRRPSPSQMDSTGWRDGWAYLAVLPHEATRQTTRYRGWLLLSAPRTVRPTRPSR